MARKTHIVRQAKVINIAAAGCMVLAGVLLLILKEPITAEKWIFGALFLIVGLAKLLGYFSNDLYRLAFQFDLAMGIFAGVIGILLLIGPEGVINQLPTVVGIYVILDGSLKFQIALDARRFGMSKWLILFITSIVICVIGIASEILIYSGLLDRSIMAAAIALIALGLENVFVTAYTVRVRAQKKNMSDKYNLIEKKQTNSYSYQGDKK